jgi:O-antigen ligase
VNHTLTQPLALGRFRNPVGSIRRAHKDKAAIGLLVFCIIHVPLAFVLSQSSFFALLHALATFAVGFALVIFSRRYMEYAAYAGAYIVGAEVIWRMSSANVYWEVGKYGMAAIFLVAILRSGRFQAPLLPVLFFLLLLPACVLTLNNQGFEKSQGLFRSYLSGPFALMVAAWFFSRLKLSLGQLQRVFLVLISPIIGVAAYTIFYLRKVTEVSFSDQSNFTMSGGFGPNQVSATLGLGFLFAFLFILLRKTEWKLKVFVFIAMIFMGVQSALTFSRGGLYNAAGAAVLAALFLMRDSRTRIKLLGIAAVLFLATNYIILPQLDAYTDGALSNRFKDTGVTGRDNIAMAELRAFEENPIFGVGVGQGSIYSRRVPHTEFTRLLAEHGSFGLAAIVILFITGWKNLKRVRSYENKAVIAATIGWGILFMLNAGMRLAAPSFAIGLAFATFLSKPNTGARPVRVKPNRHEFPSRTRNLDWRQADSLGVDSEPKV